MSPKGRFHEAMREKIMDWLREPWASGFGLMIEHTLTLDDGTILEPDFLLYERAARIQDRPLRGADIKLAIEVGDSSWTYDLNEKAAKYAAFGIAEYWAIDAVKREARVHRAPRADGWGDVRDFPPKAKLAPLAAPAAKLAL